MANLDLSFSDIYTRVSEFLGIGSSPSGTDLTLVKDIVYRAYRRFLVPIHPIKQRKHIWSFLKKRYVLRTQSGKWKYALPQNFDYMIGKPQFADQDGYAPLDREEADSILNYRTYSSTTSYPEVYAVVPSSYDVELGTTWELWLWPEPNGTFEITFTYVFSPPKPSGTTDILVGGPRGQETILQLALSIAEQQEEGKIEIQTQLANDLLSSMILADDIDSPNTLGKLSLTGGNKILHQRGFKRYGTDDVYAADR